ncbi:MAG: DUF3955 domain-containing protein [Bacteroidetes bacterium]|nr:DUF3955 domain-containing protein [Bacteroidota bacterium]
MKKYIFALLFFGLSVCCVLAFNIIGQEIAEDGTLIEPFFLIPLFYIFFLIGMVITIFQLIRSIYKSNKNK